MTTHPAAHLPGMALPVPNHESIEEPTTRADDHCPTSRTATIAVLGGISSTRNSTPGPNHGGTLTGVQT